jgi:hypothetical protein
MPLQIRLLPSAILALALTVATAAAAVPCDDMTMPAAGLKTVGRGFSSHHSGIDLLAPYGSPALAAEAGTVIFAGRYFGYGNMVDVRHGDGVVTRYGHLARFAPGLHPGSGVRTGTLLGYVGATGRATTPHLHFEVRINGRPVDPRPALALVACQAPPTSRETIEVARAPDTRRGGWAR